MVSGGFFFEVFCCCTNEPVGDEPSVRALVRLWTKLLAARRGACCWSPGNMESVPRRRDHLRPSLPFSPPSLSGGFRHRRLADLDVHACLSASPSFISFFFLPAFLSLLWGCDFQIHENLDEMSSHRDDNEDLFIYFYDYRKRKAIKTLCRGNQTAASQACVCFVHVRKFFVLFG